MIVHVQLERPPPNPPAERPRAQAVRSVVRPFVRSSVPSRPRSDEADLSSDVPRRNPRSSQRTPGGGESVASTGFCFLPVASKCLQMSKEFTELTQTLRGVETGRGMSEISLRLDGKSKKPRSAFCLPCTPSSHLTRSSCRRVPC